MKNDFNEEFQIDISEKISLEMLTYFFPIEIKYSNELDLKFKRILENFPKKKPIFFGKYRSFAKEFSTFKLNPSQWRNILSIPYDYEDKYFDYMNIHLYRGSQFYVILKVTFFVSEYCKYQMWLGLRQKLKKQKFKGGNSDFYLPDYESHSRNIKQTIKEIEERGAKNIQNFFSDLIFDAKEFNLSCIRTFSFERNNSPSKMN